MKILPISKFNFKGRIIDAHGHVGTYYTKDGKTYNTFYDMDVFAKQDVVNKSDTIEKIIISDLDCIKFKRENNREIIGEFWAEEYLGNKNFRSFIDSKQNSKYAILVGCQPGYGNVKNIERLFEENPYKFVGLKFHPRNLRLPANNELYEPYLEFAHKKGLPCVFHSERTYDHIVRNTKPPHEIIEFRPMSAHSRANLIYESAKKYKNAKIVFAHWGGDTKENIDTVTNYIISSIKNKDATLYGDISWVDCDNPNKPNIKRIIEKLKAQEGGLDRIIFGSDAPLGRFGQEEKGIVSPYNAYINTISDIKKMIRKEFPNESEEIIDKIFYKNAKELFFKEENHIPVIRHKTTSANNNKSAKFILGGIAIVGVLGGLLYKTIKPAKNLSNNH